MEKILRSLMTIGKGLDAFGQGKRGMGDAADEVIESGFVLQDDRDALLAFADPSGIPAGTAAAHAATVPH